MINWTTDRATLDTQSKIADRVMEMVKQAGGMPYKKMDILMDIDACHSNGNPLKLEELLKSDDGNFAHDVFGIRQHINRKTGKLEDCFVPRYSL